MERRVNDAKIAEILRLLREVNETLNRMLNELVTILPFSNLYK